MPSHTLATPPPSSPTRMTWPSKGPSDTAPTQSGSPVKPARAPTMAVKETIQPMVITVPDEATFSLSLDYTHTFVIGRCKEPQRAPTLASHALSFIGSQPLAFVCLPPSAKHASRLHALVRWVPFSSPTGDATPIGTFVMRILGQNGVVVQGKRHRAGQVVRLNTGENEMDFFGAKLAVQVPRSTAVVMPPPRPVATVLSPVKKMVQRAPSPAPVDVPSSPPRLDDLPMSAPMVVPASSPGMERMSSPTPSAAAPLEEAPLSPTLPAKKDTTTDTVPKPGAEFSVPAYMDLARHLVERLAPTYDLAGLLAGAIVFHRTATISASEAVRSVLASNPGMLRGEAGARAAAFSPSSRRILSDDVAKRSPAHGEQIRHWYTGDDSRWPNIARQAWHERLEEELQSKPMFGVIQRPGKDTRGNPLECWYYYDKENDEDGERALNLGAFVKPMRNVVRSQKPIFWKKSEYGRATSRNGGTSDDDKLPYSPRTHYSESDTKKARKVDVLDTTLDEPEKTWDRVGDQEWSSRPRKKRSVPPS